MESYARKAANTLDDGTASAEAVVLSEGQIIGANISLVRASMALN